MKTQTKKIELSLALLLFAVFALTQTANAAQIWTTDSAGNPVTDYAPTDTIYLHGSGFDTGTVITVSVVGPDGWLEPEDGVTDVEVFDSDEDFPYASWKLIGSDGFEITYTKGWCFGEFNVHIQDEAGNWADTMFTDGGSFKFATSGLPSGQSITVTGYWGSGSSTHDYSITFNSPGPSASTNAQNKDVYYTFPDPVTVGATTYNLKSTSHTNPFNPGSNDITVTATYEEATNDGTPPTAGIVNDGAGPGDIDTQTSTTEISANWTGFSDPESGISGYEWAIGTTSGGTNIQAFASVGTVLNATNSSLSLAVGSTYYVTVRATNGVGLQTTATSDGVTVISGGTQYLVHYEVTGNFVPVTPPADEWVDDGDPATGVFPSTVTNVAGDTRSVYVSDDRPATITENTTITATYRNEYLVEYAVTGNVVPVTPPADEWVADGDPATGVFPSTVTNLTGDTRSVYVSDDRPATITAPTTITAIYDNEYLVHYEVTGNVVPVTPPADEWVADGDPSTGVFPSTVTNVAGDTRSVYVSDDRPATITAPTTITATYKNQYLISFDQTGLDGTATGTVATYEVDLLGPIDLEFPDFPEGLWVDEGETVTYDYEILVASSTPGLQFWLSGVTGPASGFTVDSAATITGNYTELPKSALTNGGCPFDKDEGLEGQQFRLIFTQDPTNISTYKLTASNPGQFFYNVFYVGQPGDPFSLDLEIPYPFVTQGATPIHFYSNVEVVDGCYMPLDGIDEFTIDGTTSTVTPNGSLGIALDDYAEDSVTITISGAVPETGLVYVRIHLDYGLKKDVGYTKDSNNNAIGSVIINDLAEYDFTVTGDLEDSQTIQSMNVFKHDPGFAGIVTDSEDNPLSGETVEIYNPDGSSLTSVTTDEDGFYFFYYKHKGKAADYTISLTDYSLSQSVSVKANGLVEVNFTVP